VQARRVLLACGIAAAVATGGIAVMADDRDDAGAAAALAPAPAPPSLAQVVAAGTQWRLDLAGGPVRVWVPPGYHPDGAATIVYVHGYYTDLDKAWVDYRLAEQFALSAANAVFIAPEAPSGSRQRVHWPSLGELLVETFGATGVARPMGPVVAIGHSGAYRTLFTWMDYPDLDLIVAFDAMYGEVETWRAWLDASPAHRLIVVGDDTARWTEELARDLGDDVVTLDRFPDLDVELAAAIADAPHARVLYVRSQFGHMPLVTEGIALPIVTRLAPVTLLPDGPWQAPLGLPAREASAPAGPSRR